MPGWPWKGLWAGHALYNRSLFGSRLFFPKRLAFCSVFCQRAINISASPDYCSGISLCVGRRVIPRVVGAVGSGHLPISSFNHIHSGNSWWTVFHLLVCVASCHIFKMIIWRSSLNWNTSCLREQTQSLWQSGNLKSSGLVVMLSFLSWEITLGSLEEVN